MSSEVRLVPSEYETRMPRANDLAGYYDRLSFIRDEIQTGLYDILDISGIEKIIESNELYDEGGEFFQPVLDLLSKETQCDTQELFDLGIDIGAKIADSNSSNRGKILGYLNHCLHIDRLQIGLFGDQSTSEAASAIMHFARLPLVETLTDEKNSVRTIDTLNQLLHRAYRQNEFFGWHIVKFAYLAQEIHLRHEIRETALKNYPESIQSSVDKAGGLKGIEQATAELTTVTMQDRRYGLKPAYIPASFGGSWVFYDGANYIDLVTSSKASNKPVQTAVAAMIVHTPISSLEDLSMTRERIKFGSGQMSVIGGAFQQMKPDMQLFLMTDGHIYLDNNAFFPLKSIFKDQPEIYAAIVAEVTSNFYDLTVPVEKLVESGIQNISELTDKEREKFDPILKLLLPRVKLVREGPHTQEDNSDLRRVVREHSVVWHVRILPTGWKASPEARENAARLNIKLAENETFIKAHKRGEQHPVLGHMVTKNEIEPLRTGADNK